jgi:NADPH:quinone reductase-like Zn-dependent oxidoreductase
MMKAIYLDRKAGPEAWISGEIPQPTPGPGEALVKVHAATLMPTEFAWYPTFNQSDGQPRPFPVVLGHEYSGVIESLGSDVLDRKIGDPIYGMNDWFANGAHAEYCVAPISALAPKPQSLDHAHAAVVPISALTAWQGLFEKGALKAGERVLIHGGAGGVGAFAVQLAQWHGAHVIATASAANLDFVRGLGVARVIDYRTQRFEEVVHDIDVVFDSVGGETLKRSWTVLRQGGRMVTVATQSEAATEPRVRDAFMMVRGDGSQLTSIAKLIDEGTLHVFVEEVFPLDQAYAAWQHAQRGHMRGKIALQVTAAP